MPNLKSLALDSANLEQSFGLNLILNPKIQAVSLAGPAGTGKTFIALAAARRLILDEVFERLIIVRPPVPAGQELGFVPGDLDQKLSIWMQAIDDNLACLVDDKASKPEKFYGVGKFSDKEDYRLQGLKEALQLQYQALHTMRGRSIRKAIVLVDETQNALPAQLKLMLTRCGEGSLFIFTGDPSQTDTGYGIKNNALARLIHQGMSCPFIGHSTLFECRRSPLANWAIENF